MNVPEEFSGYLTKRGARVHTWRSRFFVLNQKELQYFSTKESYEKKGKKKGSIHLGYETRIGVADFEENKEKPFSFYLRKPYRTYLFFASSLDERTKWLSSIIEHINFPDQTSCEKIYEFPPLYPDPSHPFSSKDEEEYFKSLFVVGLPKDSTQEIITKYFQQSNENITNLDSKLIFKSKRNTSWVAFKFHNFQQVLKIKEFIETTPFIFNSNEFYLSALIPRCRFEDLKEIKWDASENTSENTDDIYLLSHKYNSIYRIEIDKNNSSSRDEIAKKFDVDHYYIQKIPNNQNPKNNSHEKYLVGLHFGFFPQNLKYFSLTLHCLKLGKTINLNLEIKNDEIKTSESKKEFLSKQKTKGSRFSFEDLIINSETTPPIKNVLTNTIFKIKELQSKEEDLFLLIGNEILDYNQNLPAQLNLIEAFLFQKSNDFQNENQYENQNQNENKNLDESEKEK
ncbi:sesquipedalian [Anaeramoeba ignava]|uniref:Sesquipedalian n=1 Tax=Anaeramoeba ignava TaxID=1746090 RepID=A0A9Q0LIT4_ANAIG|nr:sesquipedalian [Anaeramoeba ignava]